MNNYEKFEAFKSLNNDIKAIEAFMSIIDDIIEECKNVKYGGDALYIMITENDIDEAKAKSLIEILKATQETLGIHLEELTEKFESL